MAASCWPWFYIGCFQQFKISCPMWGCLSMPEKCNLHVPKLWMKAANFSHWQLNLKESSAFWRCYTVFQFFHKVPINNSFRVVEKSRDENFRSYHFESSSRLNATTPLMYIRYYSSKINIYRHQALQ